MARSPDARTEPGEELHRLIVQSARDYAILTIDPEGCIRSWSPGAEAVFGWSAEEAVGRDVAMTFTPEDRAGGAPEAERQVAGREGWAPDVRWHLRSDGSRVFIEGTTRALGDGAGGVRGFLKIGQDVTRRRETDAALRESEARFRAVADLVPDLLWQNDAAGRVTWYNRRWTEYTGQTEAQALGHGWVDAVHPDERERSFRRFVDALGTGAPLRQEHRIRGADGVDRWFLVQARPRHDEDGRIVQWFGAATDIHEQRAALEAAHAARAEAEEARAALERAHAELERRVAERTRELAAEIAERTRLEQSRDELLRQVTVAEEQERLRLSRELHDQMGQLVTALLLGLKSLERESGARAPAVRELERLAEQIAREIHQVAVELRPPALDRLGLRRALEAHLEEWAERHGLGGDYHAVAIREERFSPEIETTLYRVVQEALTNVARHAGATCVSLVLERRPGSVGVIVEDDGRGFDVEAATGASSATGRLGLLGMRERVRLLGGTLELESEPGRTTIFARLPDRLREDRAETEESIA